jgi:hypothetical protein
MPARRRSAGNVTIGSSGRDLRLCRTRLGCGPPGQVFVQARLTVALPISAASARLRHALAHGGIAKASDTAYGDGLAVLARVGPLGSVAGLSKQVRLQMLEPRLQGSGLRVPVRWVATGVSGRLFPALDADLEVARLEDDTSVVTITGVYTPPLGVIGARVDRLLLRHAARATMRSLLRGIATTLTSQAPAPDPVTPATMAGFAVELLHPE